MARERWDAWRSVSFMTQQQAMRAYVDLVRCVCVCVRSVLRSLRVRGIVRVAFITIKSRAKWLIRL